MSLEDDLAALQVQVAAQPDTPAAAETLLVGLARLFRAAATTQPGEIEREPAYYLKGLLELLEAVERYRPGLALALVRSAQPPVEPPPVLVPEPKPKRAAAKKPARTAKKTR